MSISGSLWRTGSSLAVYAFRTAQFAPYRPLARDMILASILFAPKHGPLSIEGMIHANGNRNLPKDSKLGVPHLPGPPWADDGQNDVLGRWDVVCRIAQMRHVQDWDYRDELIRWNRDPTEVLSVVAHSAVASASTTDPIVHPSHVAKLVQAAIEASTDKSSDSPVHIPVRILLTHTERVVVVHVPIHRFTMAVFSPLETAYDRYIETFNDIGLSKKLPRVAVEPEVSLETIAQLPTGRVLDTISLPGGTTFDVSIIQPLAGHVSILVDQDSVPLPDATLRGLTILLPMITPGTIRHWPPFCWMSAMRFYRLSRRFKTRSRSQRYVWLALWSTTGLPLSTSAICAVVRQIYVFESWMIPASGTTLCQNQFFLRFR